MNNLTKANWSKDPNEFNVEVGASWKDVINEARILAKQRNTKVKFGFNLSSNKDKLTIVYPNGIIENAPSYL